MTAKHRADGAPRVVVTGLIDVVHGGVRTILAGRPVLSNSIGFGGHDATLILTPGVPD